MLRVLLVAALVVVATSHKHYNNYHGLGSILQQGQIRPSIQLVVQRYPGISRPAAAQIIQLIISSPIQSYLPLVSGFSSVPSLSSGIRYRYLQAYLSGFPGSPFYGSYTSPLVGYLGSMGIGVGSAQLIDSLAITDFYTSSYRVRPISPAQFNQFYYQYLLGLSGPVSGYSFPQLSYFLPRLQRYSFPGRYFQSIVAQTPQTISSPSLYSGPGSAFLSVYPSIGLPYPVNPAATLGGLNSFLAGRHISLPSYVASIRGSSGLAQLVRPIQHRQYRSYLNRFRFLNNGLFSQDLIPLIGSRYVSFPSQVRSNFYYGGRRLGFKSLLKRYFGSKYFSRLSRRYRSYSPSFVGATLSGFDDYCTHRPISRLSKYKGPWWHKKLFRKGYKKYYKKHWKRRHHG